MKSRVAGLFPAFAMRHQEMQREQVYGYADIVESYLKRADRVVSIDARKFRSPATVSLANQLDDALQAQYACYIDSVAMGVFLERHFAPVEYVAGYSMGLFAALCHSGAIAFEDGLLLLRQICIMAHECVSGGRYGMGAVMGLTADEVMTVIRETSAEVEISDRLGTRSLILSGKCHQVESVLEASLDFGAMNVKLIPVNLPFHSSYLASLHPAVQDLLKTVTLTVPNCRIVSSITQAVLTNVADIRDEIARNISHAMNWHATMLTLLEVGVEHFLECGLSENLANIAKRNIRGKYTMHSARDYEQLLIAAG